MSRISLFHHGKPKASVFVDFEHWSFSLNQMYSLKPSTKSFYNEISEKYDINRIYFFGDFSSGRLSSSLDEIRTFTNNIIDTRSTSTHPEKDFTDFIMLDYIYQDVDIRPQSDVYIIFSGDGHFFSAASYLKNKKKKKVVVYGIRKAVSGMMKSVADEVVELPTSLQESERYFKMILENMDYIEHQNRIIYPTFKTTVQAVERKYYVDDRKITSALEELIHTGIIEQVTVNGGMNHQVKILKVNWELAEKKGYWVRKKEQATV